LHEPHESDESDESHEPSAGNARWEHFRHSADMGIRGFGADKAEAFEQAALALAAVIVQPGTVEPRHCIAIHCAPADDDFLFMDWINALIYEMATRHMLFCRFKVNLGEHGLDARVWGEKVNVERHRPAVEPKGATFTELAVRPAADNEWLAQCVVDV
jgi:SHS2 domain-containing protein